VGLVFGSEKHGLTREDLSYCHMMAEIPTGAGQPSMNLGQAVAVCLYELAAGEGRGIHQKSPDGTEGLPYTEADRSKAEDGAAASQGLERVAGVIEETMRAAGYSPKTMQAANRHDLRLTLRRLKLSAHDARRILGLFRRILWRLKHFPARDDKSN
jgi:tRNA/rRNA methyltransferase